ncbi:hypothetical protein GOP47_0028145 [Adiantum capillus-veneris]|nr:hypothetical protein GOP47_0028145 [Adiantum capillus-veneris]
MTTYLKLYSPLPQAADGRPPKAATAAEQALWKLPLQRKSIMWTACLVLFVCFIVVSLDYTSQYSINPSGGAAEERSESDRSDGVSPNSTSEASPISSSTTKDFASPPPVSDVTKLIDFSVGGCNIYRGDWIPHAEGPAYNLTCPFIQPNQNCIKNGRPDHGFLYWRWKPRDCELPLFDAKAFLKLVKGKKLGFIGDSLGRNSYQSVICYLAQVEIPKNTFNDGADGNMRWYFKKHDFTLTVVWTPFLVKGTEEEADGLPKGSAKLHVDVVDEVWAPTLHDYDYIVLSGGHWYHRTSVYFVQNKPVGCHYCPSMNFTDVGYGFAYRAALRTVFDFLISSKYKGVVLFRTYSPEHWENGLWNEGGNCTKTAPAKSKSIALDDRSMEMYKIQLEEFGKTVQKSSRFKFKLKIVDGTRAALLRPDAHPGPYGHDMHPMMHNDCVHWCLPGAVDTWSAMILEVMKHI